MAPETIFEFQETAVRWGAFFIGLVCLVSAVQQQRTGETFGLSGKGRVLRSEQPGYFRMLFAGRVMIGAAAVAGSLLLP